MNKRLFVALVSTSEEVFYNVQTADGRVSTLKGNKRDILKQAKDWKDSDEVTAKMEGTNLYVG